MTSATRHLIWKEYRAQRGFWIGLVPLSCVPLLAFWLGASAAAEPAAPGMFFGTALAFPAIYILGALALIFAGEHETGTIDYLRALPLSARRVFWVKLATALVGAALLAPIVWLLALLFAQGRLPDAEDHRAYLVGGAAATIELGCWSLLVGMRARRVVWALVVSAGLATGLALAIQIATDINTSRGDSIWIPFYWSLIPRLLLAGGALWVAIRWMPHWLGVIPTSGSATAATAAPRVRAVAVREQPTSWRGFSYLLWHEWRQSRGLWLALSAIYLALGAWLVVIGFRQQFYRSTHEALFFRIGMLLGPFSAISGACVFLADQTNHRHRFFAEQGIAARSVWWSRICAWTLFLGCLGAIALIGVAIDALVGGVVPRLPLSDIRSLLSFVVLAFAVGQLASLLVRSAVLAFFGGLSASIVAVSWVWWVESARLPHLLLVAPLAVALLVVSRRNARSWLIERPWRGRRLALTASIASPILVVMAVAALIRAYEIPEVQLPTDLQAYRQEVDREGLETAQLYYQALVKESDPEQSLAVFQAASRRESFWVPPQHYLEVAPSIIATLDTAEPVRDLSQVGPQAARRIAQKGLELIRQGKVDEGWEHHAALLRFARHLMHNADMDFIWTARIVEQTAYDAIALAAADEHQTAAHLRRALAAVEQPIWSRAAMRAATAHAYWRIRDEIEGRPNPYAKGTPSRPDPSLTLVRRFMPWEAERLKRYADLRIYTLWLGNHIADVRRLGETMRWAEATAGIFELDVLHHPSQHEKYDLRREVLQVQLALKLYQLEQGRYPDSLAQLDPAIVPRIPATLDVPFSSNTQLQYEPEGIEWQLQGTYAGGQTFVLPPGRPFLWFPRPHVPVRPTTEVEWGTLQAYPVP